MAHDSRTAYNAIADAINAGDAHHSHYDMHAIVADVHAATGGYDIEAMEHAEFWAVVDRHDRGRDDITVHTTTEEGTRVDTETVTRASLPLDKFVDLLAADLGCAPGSRYTVTAVGPGGAVLDTYDTTAR